MSNFSKIETGIEGLILIDVKKFGDERGYFKELYRRSDFIELGIPGKFVQENESYSKKNILRGLHFQTKHSQGKLVRVAVGSVYDVGVDLRKGSATYGKWYGTELSAENGRMLYLPEGFAHGFLVLSKEALFTYKCTDYYHPEFEAGYRYDDPTLGVLWPLEPGVEPLVSSKDAELPAFS